ncbi:hypothetical protein MKW98_001827 [Papaver atlanticum]|uniref:PWI domain-containing protein n=1 Tax=Papaver atlanticum TaxID=357466 RepID=A0AAD4S9T5_9MAGN|nr:hypothetical protein MKW98_001827 [Papaver atlanticum]
MLPMTEEMFNYEMNWAVVDKYKLHEKMRPWISNIARNSLDEEADHLVSQILEYMTNHGSALSTHEKIMSFRLVNEAECETLFLNMWAVLFSEIKNLEKVDGKKPSGVEIFSDTPKTKEEVLSLEIDWAIFDHASVVDQVVDCIKKPNHPSQMVELLQLSMDSAEIIVRILWRTLLIQVKIFETGMPEDNLRQKGPVWNSEESSDRVGGVIKRNRCCSCRKSYNHTLMIIYENRMLAFETLCEAYRLENAIPRNMEQLSSYDVNWGMSDRVELHDRLRPWIFSEIMEFVRPEESATRIVDSIVSGIKDHANAKDILELVKPSLGKNSAIFVLNLWIKIIFGIQLAGTIGLGPFPDIYRERLARQTVKISRYGGRYGRNRHFMMVAFDYENLLKLKLINETIPKTKDELFSYEIKWDVYEKYGLQKNMRRGIWIETLELIRQRKDAMPVDEQIMWSIFDYHVSASRREFDAQEEAIPVFEHILSRLHKDRASPSKMLEYLVPKLGSAGSEKFVMRMWYALICGIKLAEAGVAKKSERGSVVLLCNENL